MQSRSEPIVNRTGRSHPSRPQNFSQKQAAPWSDISFSQRRYSIGHHHRLAWAPFQSGLTTRPFNTRRFHFVDMPGDLDWKWWRHWLLHRFDYFILSCFIFSFVSLFDDKRKQLGSLTWRLVDGRRAKQKVRRELKMTTTTTDNYRLCLHNAITAFLSRLFAFLWDDANVKREPSWPPIMGKSNKNLKKRW